MIDSGYKSTLTPGGVRGKHKKKGTFVEHIECNMCSSSDALAVYEQPDGSFDGTCFSCNGFTTDPYQRHESKGTTVPQHTQLKARASIPRSVETVETFTGTPSSIEECTLHPIRELKDRGITHATCEHFGVRVGVDTRDGVTPTYHLYPYYNEEDDIYGYKIRTCSTKTFSSVGHVKSDMLFGSQHLRNSGSKVFITEGELDAMSVYQSLKENSNVSWEPTVVSLPHGVKSANNSMSAFYERINNYEQIILCLDQDAPGHEATKEICKIFAGKVYVAKISEKDPNAMIMAGKSTDLKWAVLTNARKYQPDGIINAADFYEKYKEKKNVVYYPFPSSMPSLNDKMYGLKEGTVCTVTAGTSAGKTQFLRELKYHYNRTTDLKIADISLEEGTEETISGLIALHTNKRINLPDVEITDAEEEKAYRELFSGGRYSLYDFFGGMDDDSLFSKLRYFAATGHSLIFLDHLSIIVSEFAAEGGERERIDTIMTKLAKFAKETNVTVVLVVHLKKGEGSMRTFETGAIPSVDDLRGSGSIKQLSWDIIGLSRNQQHPDEVCKNTSQLHVLKCRLTGRTGAADYLRFDDRTGRMIRTEKPLGYELKKDKPARY